MERGKILGIRKHEITYFTTHSKKLMTHQNHLFLMIRHLLLITKHVYPEIKLSIFQKKVVHNKNAIEREGARKDKNIVPRIKVGMS